MNKLTVVIPNMVIMLQSGESSDRKQITRRFHAATYRTKQMKPLPLLQ